MIAPEKLRFYLDKFEELELEDIMTLVNFASQRHLRAGEIYISEGSSKKQLAYIDKGLVRAFSRRENGEEITVWIRWEGKFFTSYDSLLFHQPSRFNYEALEDTILYEADFDGFNDLLNSNLRYSKVKEYVIWDIVGDIMAHRETFILLNPEERYIKLLSEKPDIIKRVPFKYIASFIGITPVSLSRIRTRLQKRKT